MIKINVVAVGKVKEKYFAQGIAEYQKRLGAYCNFSITEVAEENFKSATISEIEIIKEREAQRILPHLKGHVIVMAIEGKQFSSNQLAQTIDSIATAGQGAITFVIGGSYGVADIVKQKANTLMSFSNMTFPHTLFRLMLTEQLYRAFSITAGSAYHK